MRINKFVTTALWLLYSYYGFAQDIVRVSGYVTDQKTGEIVSDATVSIGTNGTVSNNYGYYTFEIPVGEHQLKASFVGFTPLEKRLSFYKDTILSIHLEKGLKLPEVVLTSNRVNRNIDSRGLGNLRVNVAQLNTSPLFLGERDIIKTIQFLPGISSGMEGSSQLNIRGGTNDQTLYLMDDVPVYNQNHTFGFFSIFNSDALLSTDLYKGGIPAIYGDRLSGIASISLKDGNYKKHQFSVGLGILAGTLSAEGPVLKERLSYMFTARRSFIDLLYNGVMALASEGDGGGGIIAFYDVNAKLSWKINDQTKLSWQTYTGYDDLYGMNKDNDEYTGEKYQEKFGFGWQTWMTSLRLTSSLKQNIFLSGNIYYTQLDNFNYFKNKIKNEDGKSKQHNRTSSLLHELGLRTKLEQKLNNLNTLSYGLDASVQQYQPQVMKKQTDHSKVTYDADQLKLFTGSIYMYDEYRYHTWLFSAGLRASVYDNCDKTKFIIEPRIKINKFIGEQNKVMLAYDMMHQPVHSINEMNYSVQTDFWVPFKEEQLPYSQQISVGWKNYAFANVTFSVEGYYKKMRNLLLIENLENYLDFHSAYKMGSGHSMGLEFMLEYSKNHFNSWASYTLSKSERTFGGKSYQFKYDAPHDISVFASYITWKKEKSVNTISVNMQYKTGYPYYVPELSYPSIGLPTLPNGYGAVDDVSFVDYVPQYPNIRLSAYFRTDINFTMEQKMRHGSRTWQFSLLNVTGHENPYAVYRKDGQYRAFILVPFLPSLSFKRTF